MQKSRADESVLFFLATVISRRRAGRKGEEGGGRGAGSWHRGRCSDDGFWKLIGDANHARTMQRQRHILKYRKRPATPADAVEDILKYHRAFRVISRASDKLRRKFYATFLVAEDVSGVEREIY